MDESENVQSRFDSCQQNTEHHDNHPAIRSVPFPRIPGPVPGLCKFHTSPHQTPMSEEQAYDKLQELLAIAQELVNAGHYDCAEIVDGVETQLL